MFIPLPVLSFLIFISTILGGLIGIVATIYFINSSAGPSL